MRSESADYLHQATLTFHFLILEQRSSGLQQTQANVLHVWVSWSFDVDSSLCQNVREPTFVYLSLMLSFTKGNGVLSY